MSIPARYRTPGGGVLTSGQVALSTSAAAVVAASTSRCSVLVRNLDASINIYIGPSGVTSANGYLLKAGESVALSTAAAVYAVAASGTPTAAYLSIGD